MTNSVDRRPSFISMSRFFLLLLTLTIALLAGVLAADRRVVSPDELAERNGKGESGEIWLSILGEVYDVTPGRSFYGEGGSYNVFAGKDGSVPFITGVFTDEEAAKLTDELTPAQLYALNHWREFYEENKEYPFVGLLEGRFYDKDGNPADEMQRVQEKLASYDPEKKKSSEL